MAIPFVLCTVTQPLHGAVDTALAGHLPGPEYIAGVSVGATIFTTMYWLFGFLRVSTTGFTAQAYAREQDDIRKSSVLFQPLLVAVVTGVLLLLMQKLIFAGSMWIISPEPAVREFAAQYFDVLIFGVPVVLSSYVILGWLMGRGLARQSMAMQISGNLLNIALDLLFVNAFHWGVTGIAAATLISQVISLLIGIYYLLHGEKLVPLTRRQLFDWAAFKNMFFVNLNLMIRTGCLLAQINLFTAVSAGFGTIVLSANSVLSQIKSTTGSIFEGFANASSVYAGRAYGNGDFALIKRTLRVTARCATWLIAVLVALCLLGCIPLIRLFSNNAQVLQTAIDFSRWIVAYPLVAGFGLTFYGIFTGASNTKCIMISNAVALACFLLTLIFTKRALGNHGLWLALMMYYLVNTVFLLLGAKKLASGK